MQSFTLDGHRFSPGVYYLGDLHAHTGYSGDAGSADMGNCTGSCGNFADVFTTPETQEFALLLNAQGTVALVNPLAGRPVPTHPAEAPTRQIDHLLVTPPVEALWGVGPVTARRAAVHLPISSPS